MIIYVEFPLDPLVSCELQAEVLLLEVEYHGNDLDEVVVHALVGLDLLHHLLGGNLFCQHFSRHFVLQILRLLLHVLHTHNSFLLSSASACGNTAFLQLFLLLFLALVLHLELLLGLVLLGLHRFILLGPLAPLGWHHRLLVVRGISILTHVVMGVEP